MSLTRAQFVERLTASGVVSAADVADFEAKVAAARETSDAQAYARLLVQHGKLTKYQAAALYQGKTKGLVLGNYVLLDKLGAGGRTAGVYTIIHLCSGVAKPTFAAWGSRNERGFSATRGAPWKPLFRGAKPPATFATRRYKSRNERDAECPN